MRTVKVKETRSASEYDYKGKTLNSLVPFTFFLSPPQTNICSSLSPPAMSSKFRSSAVKYAEKKRRHEISRDGSKNQVGSPSPLPKRVRAVLTGLVSFAVYFRFFRRSLLQQCVQTSGRRWSSTRIKNAGSKFRETVPETKWAFPAL